MSFGSDTLPNELAQASEALLTSRKWLRKGTRGEEGFVVSVEGSTTGWE
jgi:hypothetical protein